MLVFIHHDSRRVQIAGITSNPVASWVTQQARNLSMDLADRANAPKFLIRDCDTKCTPSINAVFAAEVVRVIKTRFRAPQANAICKRVIGTIRRECLDRMITRRSGPGRTHCPRAVELRPARAFPRRDAAADDRDGRPRQDGGEGSAATVTVTPDTNGVGLLEFHQIDAAREAGPRAGLAAVDALVRAGALPAGTRG